MRYYFSSYDNPESSREKKLIIFLFIIIFICLFCMSAMAAVLLFNGGGRDDIGVNITVGKLKVDIIDESNESIVGDALDFVSEDGAESLLFAPGYVCYTEGFRVKNDGNLPMSYTLMVSEDEVLDMARFYEAFNVYLTTDPSTIGSAEPIAEHKGILQVGQVSELYYLVIEMKETAGNEFQEKTYSGIGVTVIASQYISKDGE